MSDIREILTQQPILLFDGECGFCNKSVQFFLKRDRDKKMRFVSLQSEKGKLIRKYFEINDNIDSLILIRNYNAYIQSCAALRLSLYMKGLWPIMTIFLIIPPFIRNAVYALIARNRMKLFGKVENCELIASEDRARFLDI
jgi:predicted DCC family thiol-disulfide oxidoreductase YuxK